MVQDAIKDKYTLVRLKIITFLYTYIKPVWRSPVKHNQARKINCFIKVGLAALDRLGCSSAYFVSTITIGDRFVFPQHVRMLFCVM